MLQEWRVDLLPRQLSPYGAHTYHHSQGPIAVQKLPWTLFMRHPGSRSQQWANAKTPATTKGPTAKLLVRATYYSEAPSSHHPVMHPQAPSPERKGDLKPQQSGKRRCNDSLKDYQGSLFGTLSPVHPILTRVRTGQNGGATSNIKVAGRVTPWVIIIQMCKHHLKAGVGTAPPPLSTTMHWMSKRTMAVAPQGVWPSMVAHDRPLIS